MKLRCAGMRLRACVGCVLLVAGHAPFAWAAGAPEPAEVIVTAPSADGTARTAPHSVSVITREDITRSTATSVSELLSREAGVVLRSFFGGDKNAGIDLRGMGDTAGSNVLVLVDGVRLNELDLSGADLSTVPLSQIERIEVVRGAGSVRYGDGAVGGVINIRTRRASQTTPQLDVEATRGSYGLDDLRVHARGGSGPLRLALNLSQLDTEGFRNNGDLRSRNVAAEARLVTQVGTADVDAWLRLAHHIDEYGLPGPVNAADFARSTAARRGTSFPFDRGDTDDRTRATGFSLDFGQAGRLTGQWVLRDRNNNYVIGFNPQLSLDRQRSTIDSSRRDGSLRYENEFRILGLDTTIGGGFDGLSGSYARYSAGRFVPDASEQKIGAAESRGRHASLTVRATAQLAFNAGVRENRFSTHLSDERFVNACTYRFVTLPFFPVPVPVLVGCTPYAYQPRTRREADWRNTGTELGMTWRPNAALVLYASTVRQFRNPNLDELALATADLRPQSGRTHEAGVRVEGDALSWSLGVFDMVNQSEIYYAADRASGQAANRNYELATHRTGAEFQARWRPISTLTVRGNYAYVAPRFVGTVADIPHVPRNTANASFEWRAAERTTLAGALRYVGTRFDGNDLTNRTLPPLPRYLILDTSVRFGIGKTELTVGINNLTNRAYSTLGYSATYYPMPERNGFVRLRVML